jgi:hypothetical protein
VGCGLEYSDGSTTTTKQPTPRKTPKKEEVVQTEPSKVENPSLEYLGEVILEGDYRLVGGVFEGEQFSTSLDNTVLVRYSSIVPNTVLFIIVGNIGTEGEEDYFCNPRFWSAELDPYGYARKVIRLEENCTSSLGKYTWESLDRRYVGYENGFEEIITDELGISIAFFYERLGPRSKKLESIKEDLIESQVKAK